MKRKITVNAEARIAYIPKELIDEGLKGELDAYANAVTLTLVSPETSLEDVERSLEIVLEDIRFRKKMRDTELQSQERKAKEKT